MVPTTYKLCITKGWHFLWFVADVHEQEVELYNQGLI